MGPGVPEPFLSTLAQAREYFCSGARGSLPPTVGDVTTSTYRRRFWAAIQRAWRSVLLNMTLLVLAVLASAATVVILGFLANLYIQGYLAGNGPTSLGGLAVFIALVGYYIVGIPALLICTLLWLAYRASKAARARARRAERRFNPAP
jgi:hypothetical protein